MTKNYPKDFIKNLGCEILRVLREDGFDGKLDIDINTATGHISVGWLPVEGDYYTAFRNDTYPAFIEYMYRMDTK